MAKAKGRFTEKISVWIDPETKKKLEAEAEAMGLQLSDVVRMILRKHVKEEGSS